MTVANGGFSLLALWMAARSKDEILRILLERLQQELQALLESGDNFQITVNSATSRGDVKIETKRTFDLN